MPLWTVPRIWPGETCFLLGGGPSIGRMDLSCLAGRRVIAINESYRLVDSADILYFCDFQFYRWRQHSHDFRKFRGLKVSIAQQLEQQPDVLVLKQGPERGFPDSPDTLTTGSNSGFQALVLAALLGCSRIILLGYDMQPQGKRKHWHQNYPSEAPATVFAEKFLPHFPSLCEPLKERGVSVVNATPGSKLDCFPMATLDEVLASEPRKVAA